MSMQAAVARFQAVSSRHQYVTPPLILPAIPAFIPRIQMRAVRPVLLQSGARSPTSVSNISSVYFPSPRRHHIPSQSQHLTPTNTDRMDPYSDAQHRHGRHRYDAFLPDQQHHLQHRHQRLHQPVAINIPDLQDNDRLAYTPLTVSQTGELLVLDQDLDLPSPVLISPSHSYATLSNRSSWSSETILGESCVCEEIFSYVGVIQSCARARTRYYEQFLTKP